MGVILDSSVTIAAERARWTAPELMERIALQIGDEPAGFSAVGCAEILYGHYRMKLPEHRMRSERYVTELLRAVPVYPFTRKTADLAARLGAEAALHGNMVPFTDLLIGATAAVRGFSVLTKNERHFQLIPGLDVITFRIGT